MGSSSGIDPWRSDGGAPGSKGVAAAPVRDSFAEGAIATMSHFHIQ